MTSTPTAARNPGALHRYLNLPKAVEIGSAFWDRSREAGLAGIVASPTQDGRLETPDGLGFHNMSCCSYLDFDTHPAIVEGAVQALRRYGRLDHCISRVRVQLPALLELEERLAALFRVRAITAISASARARACCRSWPRDTWSRVAGRR